MKYQHVNIAIILKSPKLLAYILICSITCSLHYNKTAYMKHILLVFLAFSLSVSSFSQNAQLPSVAIKDMKGKENSFSNLFGSNSDTIHIVSLWATWCVPCIKELDAISENLSDWQKEVPLKLAGISTDDSRTVNRVKSFVTGRGWEFSIYTDVNSSLKRALNVSNIPFLFLIKNGKIIYQHEGYLPGGEDALFEKIKELKNK
jgi:cytochrome c biogenesis protein CcmG, thiol:disulfide interchange protein DsbE